jgi:dynein heavy chain
MNNLMTEVKRSLTEFDMGLAGELPISEVMDALMMSIYVNQVPETWQKLAEAGLLLTAPVDSVVEGPA